MRERKRERARRGPRRETKSKNTVQRLIQIEGGGGRRGGGEGGRRGRRGIGGCGGEEGGWGGGKVN